MKVITAALVLFVSVMTTSCANIAENKTAEILKIDNPCDMAVTLYYDV